MFFWKFIQKGKTEILNEYTDPMTHLGASNFW